MGRKAEPVDLGIFYPTRVQNDDRRRWFTRGGYHYYRREHLSFCTAKMPSLAALWKECEGHQVHFWLVPDPEGAISLAGDEVTINNRTERISKLMAQRLRQYGMRTGRTYILEWQLLIHVTVKYRDMCGYQHTRTEWIHDRRKE